MATSKRRKQTSGAPSSAQAPEQTTAAENASPAENLAAAQPATQPANDIANQATAENREPAPMLADERPAPGERAMSPAADSAAMPANASPAAEQPAASNSAGSAGPIEQPVPASISPAAERAVFVRRRMLAVAGVVLVLALTAFAASRMFTAPTGATSAPAALAETATPAAAPANTATPAATAQPAATVTPATAAAANPTAASAPIARVTCSAIANMPVYAGATCTDQDSDRDNGLVKLENTYVASASADEVRRFYEGAFAQNGWTLGEFKYDINSGQRRVEVEVDTDQGVNGLITKVQLTEHATAMPASNTCAPISGLPALPNATCVKFDTDQDDGVIKIKNTYSTTESPENVWRLFESALTQSGWAGQAFQYRLQQGPSQLEVKVEAQQDATGSGTKFKITEK